MTDQPPIANKVYYSIGEVCELAGLKAHVLRYWENQFNTLKPGKNRAGNRVYRSPDVELVLLIRHLLYEQRYTIDGANQKLKEMRKAERNFAHWPGATTCFHKALEAGSTMGE